MTMIVGKSVRFGLKVELWKANNEFLENMDKPGGVL